MFDARLRTLINPPLDKLAGLLARAGASADGLTWFGLGIGLGGAMAIAAGAPLLGLTLIAVNRLADGLDGAIARRTTPSDYGGFLDIVSDFLIYAAVPLGFALADPAHNALAAAVLLASFIASGATFLAFAAVAARRGISTEAQGRKSIYYLAGLAEGFETIAAFTFMCLWPAHFPVIAGGFAVICLISAAARMATALRVLS